MLKKQQSIGLYTVAHQIKESPFAEMYIVKDVSGKNYFLKLLNYAKLKPDQFYDKEAVESIVSMQLDHPNLIHRHDGGDLILNGQKMTYIVYDFISGETLAQRTSREQGCSVYNAKNYVSGVLNGLKSLHNLPNPIIHNELTTENVMIDMTVGNSVKIIGFSHARFLSQDKGMFQKDDVNPFYLAPEAFNGVFTIQTDIYSVGAMLYHLVFGLPPYFTSISNYQKDNGLALKTILRERQKPLKILDKPGLDEQLINIMQKALAANVEERFKNVEEFIGALYGEISVEYNPTNRQHLNNSGIKADATEKKGFAAIAGMEELKQQMQRDVIYALNEPERYKKYGVSIPNGMLLYGPPGCGKTFFAKKFAEEVNFKFMTMRPSDLQSRYVNATQENIKAMFQEAIEKAPTIIFIDEINELLPNRNDDIHEMAKSAVNEMLAQMDNPGEQGVFLIGATNMPNKIDPAALRSGRFEKKFFIGPPDFEARKAMFKLHLQNRYTDFGIQYDRLATLTENYVSADIKYIVDEAAREALTQNERISMQFLEDEISRKQPSVSTDDMNKYFAIKEQFENNATCNNVKEKKRIGFKKD